MTKEPPVTPQELRTLQEAVARVAQFMAIYDRFGSRPGLDPTELYGIDGGDSVEGGASIRQSDLRTITTVLPKVLDGLKVLELHMPLYQEAVELLGDARHVSEQRGFLWEERKRALLAKVKGE